MANDEMLLDALARAVAGPGNDAARSSTHAATVTRLDPDGTMWVSIPGGANETPVRTSLVTAEPGDVVQVTIADGRATATGNESSPAANASTVTAAVEPAIQAAAEVKASLVAESAKIAHLEADTAKVHDLTADQLTAAVGYIDDLTSASVTAEQLAADHATVGSLDANYAQIGLANVNTAQITNGIIQTASIVDEQVFTVSGNKATIARIDASKINVENLNADNITVNKINGQPVTGKSISDALSQHETDISTKVDTTTFNNTVEGLNDRIDGAIETFTGTVVPTLNNTPASAWNTTKLRDEHVGDVYYVVNASSQQNGYCYRFTKSGSTYSWQLIKDSDVTAALSRLQTAEGKITTFDSDISTLKTDTGELKTKTQSLETSLGDKVDVTTFNNLSSDVEENSATITTLSQKTETLANPNIAPFFSMPLPEEGSTSDDYWYAINPDWWTPLSNGWAHFHCERDTTGWLGFQPKASELVVNADGTYTMLFEIKNLVRSDGVTTVSFNFEASASYQISCTNKTLGNGNHLFKLTARSSLDATTRLVQSRVQSIANVTMDFDIRVSLYEGAYDGPYKPYVGSYSEIATISNTVNSVKQTATSNSTTISQLTRTLGTNADGTTADEDIVHRTSAVEQDLDTYKTTVSSTYATKTALGEEVSARETAIEQLDDEISLNAKRTESLMTFVPTKHERDDSDFWYTKASSTYGIACLDDGWWHVDYTNTSTSAVSLYVAPRSWGQVIPGEEYTFLIEIRNYTSEHPETGTLGYNQEIGGAQFYGNLPVEKGTNTYIYYQNLVDGAFVKRYVKKADVDHLDGASQGLAFRYRIYLAASKTSTFDFRISVYPGDYEGPYNEYLTATSSAQLMVANDEIAARVEKNGVIAAINASVEEEGGSAVKISADKVNIEGAAIFTSNGRLSQTSLDNAYDSKGSASAVQTNLDNLEIGGRNLALATGESKTSAASSGDSAYTGYYKLSDYGHALMNNSDDTWYCSYDYSISGNSETNVNVYFQFRGTTTVVSQSGISGDASGHIARSFKLSTAQASSTANTCRFRMQRATDGATVTISNFKLEKGNRATDWTPAPEDVAADAVKRTQRIYYRKEVTGAPAAPSSWVVSSGDGSNAWTQKHISINSADKYIYTCEQYEMADGTLGNTSILLDDTITVIDGGKILTGSVEANALKANSLTLGQISTDAQSSILNSNVQVGGRNLLQKTATLEAEDVVMVRGTVQDAGVMQLTPTTSAAYFQVKTNYLDYADFGDGEYTVSCDAKLADVESTYTNTSFSLYLGYSDEDNIGVAFANNAHHKYVGLSATANQPLTDSWQRFSVTFKVPDRLTSGSLALADGVYMGAGSYVPGSRKPILVRRMKVERGTKATDWTLAPEEMASEADYKTISTQVSGHEDALKKITEDYEKVIDRIDGLESTTSWLAFSEELGLVIGDRASGETFFFTQQTGSSMTFNRSVSGTTQELMALSGTNGIEGPKATVDEVITPLVHSPTWSISMDGDMFSIDYIGS